MLYVVTASLSTSSEVAIAMLRTGTDRAASIPCQLGVLEKVRQDSRVPSRICVYETVLNLSMPML